MLTTCKLQLTAELIDKLNNQVNDRGLSDLLFFCVSFLNVKILRNLKKNYPARPEKHTKKKNPIETSLTVVTHKYLNCHPNKQFNSKLI